MKYTQAEKNIISVHVYIRPVKLVISHLQSTTTLLLYLKSFYNGGKHKILHMDYVLAIVAERLTNYKAFS